MTLEEKITKPDGEATGAADLESLLEGDYGFNPLQRGEVREGTIVHLSPSEILIDLGAKSEGIVSGKEMERMSKEELEEFEVGDQVLAYVVNPEDKNGNIVLSLSRAQLEKDWRKAEELFESQEMFSGDAAGYNKGGLIVRVGKVRGFVPASQLASARLRQPRDDKSSEPAWESLVGETLQLKVIEIDRSRNRLILSERAAIREWRKAQKEKLLEELAEGEVRTGEVISLADFGAFVDLGGADGLIHLSELSWKRVNHPREVLQVGDEVEVYVINVDRERRRIGLSLKRLQPDPWSLVEDKYQVSQLVEGTITKLVKFGAFARLAQDEEIEGLIHISELSEGHIAHPREVVEEGQVVTLRIIRIDADRRRMGLSLKRVDQAEYADQDWQAELRASQEEAALDEGDEEEQVPAKAESEADEVAAQAEPEEPAVAQIEAEEQSPPADEESEAVLEEAPEEPTEVPEESTEAPTETSEAEEVAKEEQEDEALE